MAIDLVVSAPVRLEDAVERVPKSGRDVLGDGGRSPAMGSTVRHQLDIIGRQEALDVV